MTLTNKQLGEVCLLWDPDARKTCRYLVNDELDGSKWYCQKLRPEAKEKIDESIASLGNKPRLRANIPCGDNCDGYPLLKHVQQGFDVD